MPTLIQQQQQGLGRSGSLVSQLQPQQQALKRQQLIARKKEQEAYNEWLKSPEGIEYQKQLDYQQKLNTAISSQKDMPNELEKQGYTKQQNADGSITYSAPVQTITKTKNGKVIADLSWVPVIYQFKDGILVSERVVTGYFIRHGKKGDYDYQGVTNTTRLKQLTDATNYVYHEQNWDAEGYAVKLRSEQDIDILGNIYNKQAWAAKDYTKPESTEPTFYYNPQTGTYSTTVIAGQSPVTQQQALQIQQQMNKPITGAPEYYKGQLVGGAGFVPKPPIVKFTGAGITTDKYYKNMQINVVMTEQQQDIWIKKQQEIYNKKIERYNKIQQDIENKILGEELISTQFTPTYSAETNITRKDWFIPIPSGKEFLPATDMWKETNIPIYKPYGKESLSQSYMPLTKEPSIISAASNLFGSSALAFKTTFNLGKFLLKEKQIDIVKKSILVKPYVRQPEKQKQLFLEQIQQQQEAKKILSDIKKIYQTQQLGILEYNEVISKAENSLIGKMVEKTTSNFTNLIKSNLTKAMTFSRRGKTQLEAEQMIEDKRFRIYSQAQEIYNKGGKIPFSIEDIHIDLTMLDAIKHNISYNEYKVLTGSNLMYENKLDKKIESTLSSIGERPYEWTKGGFETAVKVKLFGITPKYKILSGMRFAIISDVTNKAFGTSIDKGIEKLPKGYLQSLSSATKEMFLEHPYALWANVKAFQMVSKGYSVTRGIQKAILPEFALGTYMGYSGFKEYQYLKEEGLTTPEIYGKLTPTAFFTLMAAKGTRKAIKEKYNVHYTDTMRMLEPTRRTGFISKAKHFFELIPTEETKELVTHAQYNKLANLMEALRALKRPRKLSKGEMLILKNVVKNMPPIVAKQFIDNFKKDTNIIISGGAAQKSPSKYQKNMIKQLQRAGVSKEQAESAVYRKYIIPTDIDVIKKKWLPYVAFYGKLNINSYIENGKFNKERFLVDVERRGQVEGLIKSTAEKTILDLLPKTKQGKPYIEITEKDLLELDKKQQAAIKSIYEVAKEKGKPLPVQETGSMMHRQLLSQLAKVEKSLEEPLKTYKEEKPISKDIEVNGKVIGKQLSDIDLKQITSNRKLALELMQKASEKVKGSEIKNKIIKVKGDLLIVVEKDPVTGEYLRDPITNQIKKVIFRIAKAENKKFKLFRLSLTDIAKLRLQYGYDIADPNLYDIGVPDMFTSILNIGKMKSLPTIRYKGVDIMYAQSPKEALSDILEVVSKGSSKSAKQVARIKSFMKLDIYKELFPTVKLEQDYYKTWALKFVEKLVKQKKYPAIVEEQSSGIANIVGEEGKELIQVLGEEYANLFAEVRPKGYNLKKTRRISPPEEVMKTELRNMMAMNDVYSKNIVEFLKSQELTKAIKGRGKLSTLRRIKIREALIGIEKAKPETLTDYETYNRFQRLLTRVSNIGKISKQVKAIIKQVKEPKFKKTELEEFTQYKKLEAEPETSEQLAKNILNKAQQAYEKGLNKNQRKAITYASRVLESNLLHESSKRLIQQRIQQLKINELINKKQLLSDKQIKKILERDIEKAAQRTPEEIEYEINKRYKDLQKERKPYHYISKEKYTKGYPKMNKYYSSLQKYLYPKIDYPQLEYPSYKQLEYPSYSKVNYITNQYLSYPNIVKITQPIKYIEQQYKQINIPSTTPPPPLPPPPPTFILPPEESKQKKKLGKAFNVLIKMKMHKLKKGKYKHVGWLRANPKPLDYYGAKALGQKIVDTYTQRSFKLQPTKSKTIPSEVNAEIANILAYKFRTAKHNKDIFVEKSKYAISSYEEKLGIPWKAQELRKSKKQIKIYKQQKYNTDKAIEKMAMNM